MRFNFSANKNPIIKKKICKKWFLADYNAIDNYQMLMILDKIIFCLLILKTSKTLRAELKKLKILGKVIFAATNCQIAYLYSKLEKQIGYYLNMLDVASYLFHNA